MISFRKPLRRLSLGFAIALLIAGVSVSAHAQPYIGQVVLVPYNFAPAGWMFCEGQLLAIAENDVLFALIGTTFGGDGQTNFALPDYRGRVPISSGQGPGLSDYLLGETGGVENITLTVNQMPAHTHPVNADSGAGSSKRPANALIAADAATIPQYGSNARTQGAATEVVPAGGNQSHEILQPYTTFHWIISLYGVFPPPNIQFDKKADGESKK